MKRRFSNIARLLAAVILTGGMAACQNDLETDFYLPEDDGTFSLSLIPSLDGIDDRPVTRTDVEGDDALMENYLGTHVDVFVKGVTDPTFWKQYHKDVTDGLTVGTRELLAVDWKDEGLRENDKYDVYVAVNCEQTNTNIASLDDLLALTLTDEKTFKRYSGDITEDVMARTPDKKFAMTSKISDWTPDPNTDSQTFDLAQSDDAKLKRVLSKIQIEVEMKEDFFKEKSNEGYTFGQVSWKYANFNFKARVFEEGEDLAADFALDNPVARDIRSAGIGSEIGNWYTLLDTKDIGTYQPVDEGGNPIYSERTRRHGTIVTYSYPEYWGDEVAQWSPFLLLRMAWTDEKDSNPDTRVSYHYYRIPITSEYLDKLQRNHLYKVNALIASEGSSSIIEDAPITVNYEELPWMVVGTDESTVAVDRLFYLMANPLEYQLYGNGSATGTQELDIQYYITEGYTPTLDVSTLKVSYTGMHNDSRQGLYNDDDETGLTRDLLALARDPSQTTPTTITIDGVSTNVRVYRLNKSTAAGGGLLASIYYDAASGNYYTGSATSPERITQAYGNVSVMNAGGAHLVMVLPDQQVIRLVSDMEVNYSVKTINFDIYTEFTAKVDGVDKTETITRSLTVTHLPIDEVSSFKGAWSSRTQSTEYSYNPAADGWDTSVTYKYRTVLVSELTDGMELVETVSMPDGSPADNNGTWTIDDTVTGAEFRTAIPISGNQYNANNTLNRRNANSQANARLADDGWYYWGENPTTNNVTTANRDYREGSGWNATDYRYQDYKRIQYNRDHYYVKQYYKAGDGSTGIWVDWSTDQERNTRTSARRIFDTHFIAKAFSSRWSNGETDRIYGIRDNQANNGTYYATAVQSTTYSTGNQGWGGFTPTNQTIYDYTYSPYYYYQGTMNLDLTNNSMYVIQINATSANYVIGRPTNTTDHVVSPAFMIASQLGATTPFTGSTAPADSRTHCETYMEVGVDGTRYTGWRLPTREEIGIILGYQFSVRTMDPVLTGDYYWTLEGKAVKTGVNNNATGIINGQEGIYMNTASDANNTTGGNVRCIRDLTEADIARLKAQQ